MSARITVTGFVRSAVLLVSLTALTMLAVGSALALDVTRPAAVTGVAVDRSAGDVGLSWEAVLLDAAGHPEVVDHYNVYRGVAPNFVPDKFSFTNRIGTTPSVTYDDLGVAEDGINYYYKVGAVDSEGHESNLQASLVTTAPVLSGDWTHSSIDVDWTSAEPSDEVASYRVYYGKGSGAYESVEEVGLATSTSLTSLELDVAWYVAVTAVDGNGNETAFSNEHVDAVAGTAWVRAQDHDELCWGASDCTPTDPRKIQRSNGWQILVPAEFPPGDWTSVMLRVTLESRLCKNGQGGTTNKCGSGNPCLSPPCNGGYNPCGDPWDRLAQFFLVLDDCIETGAGCINSNNLELMRAVTPFGTDAEPPEGSGYVDPRVLELDITPFLPLLSGIRYVGGEIGHYVQKGHWITLDFRFSKSRTFQSPKPPADGIEIVGFGHAPLPVKQITVPATATEIKARVFTTGHGGGQYCDGGTNNAEPCDGNGDCPGGVCYPCDEFCHRTNKLQLDGAPIWQVIPFRTDCSPGPSCATWNACGYPSCTYPRAGWCPGYIACHHNAPCDNDIDLTSQITPGGTYDFDYDITPRNGSWPVSVVLYWYE